jgi:hypothetical protein
MRAPDDKQATFYSNEDRDEIARQAKLLGHDAHQSYASRLPGVPPLTLIEMLEYSALLIRKVDTVLSAAPKPTPKQRARLLYDRLAAIKKFQRSFGADEDDVFIQSPEFEKQQGPRTRLHDALTDVAEYTRGQLEDLSKEVVSYSHENPGRPELNAFQAHALNLWRQMGGGGSKTVPHSQFCVRMHTSHFSGDD